jgi:hypothetical protein
MGAQRRDQTGLSQLHTVHDVFGDIPLVKPGIRQSCTDLAESFQVLHDPPVAQIRQTPGRCVYCREKVIHDARKSLIHAYASYHLPEILIIWDRTSIPNKRHDIARNTARGPEDVERPLPHAKISEALFEVGLLSNWPDAALDKYAVVHVSEPFMFRLNMAILVKECARVVAGARYNGKRIPALAKPRKHVDHFLAFSRCSGANAYTHYTSSMSKME